MAMTITELQAFIDSKPDVRFIVNEIADYLQANPSGGAVTTIYTGDGSLSGDRTIDLNGHEFEINTPSTVPDAKLSFFYLSPEDGTSYLRAFNLDGSKSTNLALYADDITDPDNPNIHFELSSNDAFAVGIEGNATNGRMEFSGTRYTFNGSDLRIDGLSGVGTRAIAVDENGKIVLAE